ncbi:MAG: RagB/SusD family nutrient uptake outer membrane protein [Cyclobacteriaceae bacterium]|nr:RagB/SusD family nutrient uptake outer membrane protein [Cyclobacteriaceae bacterium]
MKNLSLFIFLLFLASSCEDVLEEVPQDFVSSANFWQRAEDAETAVKGIYSVDLTDPYNDQFLELHSDFATGRGSWASISFWDKGFDNTHIGRSDSYWWERPYRAINRANGAIANIPNIDMDEDSKKSLIAEALFMRAWNYFNLVRAFGAVPLRLEPTEDLSAVDVPRTPETTVYAQIIEDLTVGETDLPNSQGNNTRRPSKWAAKMLLAQVYLTMENWSLAATKAEEVINSGEFAIIPVSTSDDFYDIFAKRPTTEDVMSIHYSSTITDSYVYTLHRGNIPEYNNNTSGFYTTLPVTTTIIGAAWDNNDLRKGFNLYTKYVNKSGNLVNLPSSTPVLFKKVIAQPDGTRSNARYYLRFTENYLIYAEAAAMAAGAPTAQALEYLNIIRRRAYGHDPFAPSVDDYPGGMTLTQFRDAVILERAYEFINEQRRWWDLLRTGKAKDAIEAAFGVTFNEARLKWPLPLDEINNNGAISQTDQNPGY